LAADIDDSEINGFRVSALATGKKILDHESNTDVLEKYTAFCNKLISASRKLLITRLLNQDKNFLGTNDSSVVLQGLV
jgi:hypothetical protein